MSRQRAAFSVYAVLVALGVGTTLAEEADTILLNGRIYTVDREQPWVEAVAISAGRFVFVGDSEDARAYRSQKTKVIDLHGQMAMPGLNDAHAHPVLGGIEGLQCLFPPTAGPEDIAARLTQCISENPEAEWVVGGRWDSNLFEANDLGSPREWLDRVSGDKAVSLADDTGHNRWVNSKALDLAGIGPGADVTGGEIVLDDSGRPNGLLLESAMLAVLEAIPPLTHEQFKEAGLTSLQTANRFGITGVMEAGDSREGVKAYKALDDEGKINVHLSVAIVVPLLPDGSLDVERLTQLREDNRSTNVNTDYVKIFLDGVPTVARTAAMLDPYAPEKPGGDTVRGDLLLRPDVLKTLIAQLDAMGITVVTHTAGDRAVRVTLDAIAHARAVNGDSGLRHQLAHAGFIHKDDIARFAGLDAVADTSPYLWYPSPIMDNIALAVGPRGRNYWPIRALLDAGVNVVTGSDYPAVIPSMNPWTGMESMVTRRHPEGAYPGEFWPEQAISLKQALEIFTMGGARALKLGDDTGSIEVGKFADLIVLNHNLLEIDPAQISETEVQQTYFKGELVYQAASSYIGEWPTYGGAPEGTQYSSLKQVNPDNVDQLEVAWTYNAGDLSAGTEQADATVYQVTPIYVNETVYLCTPFNHVVALDPATGQERWRYNPERELSNGFYGSNYCRGVAYWQSNDAKERAQSCGKRIFQATLFGVLVAVDADSGVLCSDFGNAGEVDLNSLDYKGDGSVYSTSPPAIYEDIVIVGGGIYDNAELDAVDGIVRGFDARTGDERWNWNPIPEHLSDKTGGANAWAPLSVDHRRGWVFVPTTSPSLDLAGINRTDPIPDANAVVALNALSGERVWSFQTVHHDLWDYDLASMPTLVEVNHEGRSVSAVLQATKMGFVFLLDRDTGKPLFPVEETPVPQTDVPGEYTSPTQPIPQKPPSVTSTQVSADEAWGLMLFDQRACRKELENFRNEGIYTPPSETGSILHPGYLGGVNWGGVAYDEASGLAVMNSSNLVAWVKLIPRDEYDEQALKDRGNRIFDAPGAPYVIERGDWLSPFGFGAKKPPCNPPPWGRLTAIDMNTGEIRWQVPFGQLNVVGPLKSPQSWGAPNQGGPIITGGGLIFIGASPDGLLRAYDLETGELVWTGAIPAPATATPMTYQHQERQYIVVAAGGNQDFHTEQSDAIVAFALKKD